MAEIEDWRELKCLGFGNYEVSSLGRVRNRTTKEVHRGAFHKSYHKVQLSADDGRVVQPFVHVLVASIFVPNPENKPTVHHIDSNRQNNHYTNLSWATMSEQSIERKVTRRSGRSVLRISLDKQTAKKYSHVKDVALEMGSSEKSIRNACKSMTIHKGYYWAFCDMIPLPGEKWAFIPGFKRYIISNMGTIKNVESGRALENIIQEDGYKVVQIMNDEGKYEAERVHRLVAAAFLGPDSRYVNHKNCVKHDNRLENLEYVTALENNLHAIAMGHCRKVKSA